MFMQGQHNLQSSVLLYSGSSQLDVCLVLNPLINCTKLLGVNAHVSLIVWAAAMLLLTGKLASTLLSALPPSSNAAAA